LFLFLRLEFDAEGEDFILTEDCQCYFVARFLFPDGAEEQFHLGIFFAVHLVDDVADFESRFFGGAVGDDFGDARSRDDAELVGAFGVAPTLRALGHPF
jgi:hypothetical protein